MSRVINTDSTGKQRNQLLRTIAELLRRLSQKQEIDEDAKDMAAHLVLCLRDIDLGIDSSAAAWEKRDYWMKADELRTRWAWAGALAAQIQQVVLDERWNDLPATMVKLMPRVSDIDVNKLTRKESTWRGSYGRLLMERPGR
ncbi:MAG: hypothetical protein L6Q98_03770 [Anaerolineae bacterium]|nr:hypothetical protein [Anaerolineae bacterium]NUQ02288.1 hypothetical protein [Anaerolineae bacterium]